MSYRSSPAFAARERPGLAPRLECGRCRICGCTEHDACVLGDEDEEETCGWADATYTLCDNPACVASARAAAAESAP
jgi:hypothetical protein